jgi:aryl-alcohol dehydrogenase-like predicted oxidoreductase
MKTKKLGNTGVSVSEYCLGAMYFGSHINDVTSFRLLDQYVETGGSFIDTANVYAHWIEGFTGGDSETLIGKWIRDRKNRREIFIASKVGFSYQEVEIGLSAGLIETECEKSLKRLGVDCIDLYYAHVDDPNTPLEETMKAFDQLINKGKVRFIGASNYLAWRLEEARWVSSINNLAEYCCIQQRYTYLRPNHGAFFGRQKYVNNDLIEYCQLRGLTLLAYSPLLSGAFSSRQDRNIPEQYLGKDTDARISALGKVANDINATPSQIVLAWLRHNSPLTIPLVAGSTPEQMEENYDALNIELSKEQMTFLNEAGALKS